MSRSNPLRSSIAERLRQKSDAADLSASHAAHARSLRRRLNIKFPALMRWLHIYLSMFGLAAVLFFSVTGITLNHPDWFFGESSRRVEGEGRVDVKWLHLKAPSTSDADPSDATNQVDRFEVVEHLRKVHRITGAVAEFRADESECLVTFKGPGYSADAVIDRSSGRYTVSQQFHGFVAIINDL